MAPMVFLKIKSENKRVGSKYKTKRTVPFSPQRLIVNWKAGASDHSIINYCNKLSSYADSRNK